MEQAACRQCGSPDTAAIASYQAFAHVAAVATDERKPLYAYICAHPETAFTQFIGCRHCDFIRIDPLPTAATLMQFYQNYYASGAYAGKRDKKIRRTLKRLKKLTRYVATGRFLDVGCNVGFAVEAARMAGFEATGIEIDATAVRTATEHFPLNRYFATTIEDFTPEQPFDLVHCTEVIEHAIDTNAFAAHLARLTKPGGYLFLTTPDAGHWRRPKSLVAWPEIKPLEHITWQTRRSLTLLLESHGFAVVHTAFTVKPGLRLTARRLAD
ncbi:MAG: class I SAM-dependent methyltransferase [Alphaproteobacteria bacterium]|nr:class I SAM-dependent methyltransferase [Alphaproteobacteria bacterium]